MIKTDKAKLRDAVRDCMAEMLANGRGSSRRLVEMMRERHADLLAQHGAVLIDNAIADMARQERRRGSGISRHGKKQLPLPLGLQDLRPTLPETITVPNDSGDPDWVSLEAATLEDLIKYINLLTEGIKADNATLAAVKQVFLVVRPIMQGSTGMTVGTALRIAAEGDHGAA